MSVHVNSGFGERCIYVREDRVLGCHDILHPTAKQKYGLNPMDNISEFLRINVVALWESPISKYKI
jgi:hypothetical protein